jgi:APA family basic amino acid/polyamine antiporter
LLILVWVITGIVTLFGALTNAEIAGMISATGGQYVFFQKMYGRMVAYLYGWGTFIVIQTGSIAAIAYVFAQYLGYFVPMPHLAPAFEAWTLHIPFIGDLHPLADIGVKATTIACIGLLTFVNHRGVLFGGRVQALFTVLKVAAILLLVALAFGGAHGTVANFGTTIETDTRRTAGLLGAMIAAMSGAFWAYDGWNNITYIAGEVHQPQRNIPRALFMGTLIVIVTYVLVNLAYLYVLPIGEMAQSTLVAADVASKALGNWGGAFVAIAVIVSTFGTTNGTILVSARVYYAMARDGLFAKRLGTVHPVYKTPSFSLWMQMGWASVLVLTGTFDTLTDMLIFVSWIFYALGAFGVFVLRRKMPEAPRPYRVWGYPYVPAVFVLFAVTYVAWTLIDDIASFSAGRIPMLNSVAGLVLVATGLPVYWWYNRRLKIED